MMPALLLRILSRGAAAIGVDLTPFAFVAGLVLAAIGTAPAAFTVGRLLGWHDGAASADRTAELNTARRDLADARADLSTARATSARAEDQRAASAAAEAVARKRASDYAAELAKRGPAGPCALGPRDRRRLRDNAWARRSREPAEEPAGGG